MAEFIYKKDLISGAIKASLLAVFFLKFWKTTFGML